MKVLPSFFRGAESKINALPIKNGGVYVAVDTRNLFFDVSDTTRIKISGDGGNIDIDELNIYTKDEVNDLIEKIKQGILDIVSYEVILEKDGWVEGTDENEGYFIYDYVNNLLICGKDGITSPLVTYTDINREEFHLIYDANATAEEGILFRAVQKPENDIKIIITDFGKNTGTSGNLLYLNSISISQNPTKLTYVDGDLFDPAGMKIYANYTVNDSQSTSKRITDYTYEPKTLIYGTEYIVISYTEGDKTVSANLPVNVVSRLESIIISNPPTKLDYEFGESFNPAGMTITANYSNSTNKEITGYTYTPTVFNQSGQQQVIISYSENGITQTTQIIVNIAQQKIGAPVQNGILTYTGQVLTPTWSNYDPDKMTIGGTTSATDAGIYYVTFTLKEGYTWDDIGGGQT